MKTFYIILIITIIIIVLIFAICAIIYNQLVWRKTIKIPKFIEKMIAGNEMPDKYEELAKKAEKNFKSLQLESVELTSKDGAKLKARILIPKISNGRLILACHGARSHGTGEFAFMSDWFYKNGYTVIMPDHRGCGESDGKYMGYGIHESNDTFLWLDYAKKRFGNMPVFLLGVSMGAATVLMMNDRLENYDNIKGTVADCSYTSAWDEFSYQMKTSFHLPNFPILHICNLYNKILTGFSFKDASPLNSVKNATKPILFIHGEKDDFVPFYMRDILYDNCPSKKFKLSVKDAVHARSYFTNPKIYEDALENFFNFCLNENKK